MANVYKNKFYDPSVTTAVTVYTCPSENTVFTGKITHAERNLNKLGEKKKEDVDKLKY